MRYSGPRVVRKGDLVKSLKHAEVYENVILDSDPKITDHGVPVARQGHKVGVQVQPDCEHGMIGRLLRAA
ncbi:hypothetical protein [Paraburkholderia lycopersici]|uniref:Uncharacterized protein n=1 Tax=Paraburkholderia lycopersici TaxID=416944 RepID=A0A1G7DH46_9BURK|nr:hypothetical protein [Paraburkholderia lycopersici]SDE50386.1 hypothetical protein SAMN05421548_1597 [Paraburkholderia lycopersici]